MNYNVCANLQGFNHLHYILKQVHNEREYRFRIPGAKTRCTRPEDIKKVQNKPTGFIRTKNRNKMKMKITK
jgi:hypothetical protein